MKWSWDYAWTILPELLAVLPVTIAAALCGFALAVVLGLPLALGKRSGHKALSRTVSLALELIRSTPLLIQLLLLFYALPLYGVRLSPFAAGVLGLGIHYAAYMAEVYRSGIEAVPAGQWEAAKALNFTPRQTWMRLIIPQAVPPVLPVMGNYLIVLFKETPILSAITLVEILQKAKSLGSVSFRYIEAFTLVGVLFFLLSYGSSLLLKQLENGLRRKRQTGRYTKKGGMARERSGLDG
ncbi:ectoine/hydroxyectoine ABC transporter permease subunit EhuD [Paenibacillus hodogayensis]|uniref:Ectoine/hydroxyectoine ABC transporter permease subunit EhuD n=1 Tax=Paenibacillus hodogayensis TaxID=279208 RepID=A0ABV5VU36_9BACL